MSYKVRLVSDIMIIEPFPYKKYSVIYADPPWDIGGYPTGTKKGINNCELPYNTMSDFDIINLPIKNIAENDSILFIWCVDSKIPVLKDLMDNWGFQFKCLGFIWHKKAKTTNGDNAPYSMFTRRSCEYCFIGTRGRYIVKKHNVNQFISTPKESHSTKPAVFRSSIVELCGELSRIELFSRDNIYGWDAWGNQVPTHQQLLLNTTLESTEINETYDRAGVCI